MEFECVILIENYIFRWSLNPPCQKCIVKPNKLVGYHCVNESRWDDAINCNAEYACFQTCGFIADENKLAKLIILHSPIIYVIM
jgi:hypothetical protein